MELELGADPFELIKVPYLFSQAKEIIGMINKANSCFIGPGLGMSEETFDLLKK